MAGSLVKIDEEIVTSAVASVTLGGADWDSSYDVYMVKMNNILGSSNNTNLAYRVTESGTPNTTANYDWAFKELKTTTFSNRTGTNQNRAFFNQGTGNVANEDLNNGIFYIFNANNSSEYTFFTWETVFLHQTAVPYGAQGGNVFTQTSSVNGLQFFFDTGNIASGTFTLYGLKK